MDTLRNHPGQVGAHTAKLSLCCASLHRHAITGSCLAPSSTRRVLQVADLDAIIQTSDFPCMLRLQPGTGALAPPIFGYNSHPKFVDIPFPDYSYWGHEYRRLLGELCSHQFPPDQGQTDTEHARHLWLIPDITFADSPVPVTVIRICVGACRLGWAACTWLGEAVWLSDREVSGSRPDRPEGTGHLARQNGGSRVSKAR